jgi:hypothetical protein
VQRHALGLEFAEWTLRRWGVEGAVAAYGERLLAMAGRPGIPEALRAA